MSCRRVDRRRLLGCTIGDVGVRGCSRECCPCPTEKISENIRHHLTKYRDVPARKWNLFHPTASGRTGLAYPRCQSHYRPKFICAKPWCRRSVKLYYDPSRFEYDVDKFQGWSRRPLRERDAVFAKAWRSEGKVAPLEIEDKEREELLRRYISHPEDTSTDEVEKLERLRPSEWWLQISGYRLCGSQLVYEHSTRCPSCGEAAMKVGSNFEIPAKTDDRAWKVIQSMIDSGKDMVACFEFCPTKEEFEEMVREAERARRMEKHAELWKREKQRRLRALGLSPLILGDETLDTREEIQPNLD